MSTPTTRRPRRARRDDGYVLPFVGLVLTVLMISAAFAVDVGGWYARATQIQRAADSAALAGVVWMPDITKARQVALEAAAKNGFVPGGDIAISVDPVSGNNRQLKVTITDSAVDIYFASVVQDEPSATRAATAEYVLPVPLGSPENRIGNDPTTGFNPNLWASISGPYTDRFNGDPYSTKCPNGSAGTGCPQTNTEYRTDGYLYAIDVPASEIGNTLTVQLYDAGHYQRPNYANVETADRGVVNTQFELFQADDTPLDTSDNLIPANSLAGSCSTGPGRQYIAANDAATEPTFKNRWFTLCSVPITKAGWWMLQVKSSDIAGVTDDGDGWNQYSVRTASSSGNNPQLFAVNDLSLFNNLPGQSGNINATFFLAEVEQIHRNKKLEIGLYDPGDGASGNYFVNIELPGGATTTCTYGARGEATTTVSPCRIQTRAPNIYNGKWLDISVDIAGTYTCAADCWWKIKYEFLGVNAAASPNDRTVWTAQIVGDPVHLVNEN